MAKARALPKLDPKGVTSKGFWDRLKVTERVAAVRGAKFEDDTPAKRRRRMAEAVVLPERFNSHYLPHYFRGAAAAFHAELYRALETSRRTVVRAPRGHAKSTVVTFAYVAHQVVCARVLRGWLDGTLASTDPELHAEILQVMREARQERYDVLDARRWAGDPDVTAEMVAQALADLESPIPLHWDPYIQVISVTEDTAAEFTEAIKLELLDNDLLRSDWGEVLDDPRCAAGDWVSVTDVRVRAFGMMSAIRGGKHRQYRPTLAVFDDPDSEETVGTQKLREKQLRKLTAGVNFGLEPKVSRVMVLGTPVHAGCIVCALTAKDRFGRWTKLRYRAIRDDGKPLWPERWSLDDLRAEEDEDPDAFAMEMMDTPPSTGNPFATTHYYKRDDHRRHLPTILWFDPALGKTEKADFQAIVVIRGPTAEGAVLVHRVEALRIPDPAELVATIVRIVEEERPDLSGIESIGFQSLLTMLLQSGTDTAGLFIGWQQIPSQTESKDLRIRGMSTQWNRARILLPDDRSCRALELQAGDYPNGKKDLLDALEMALRYVPWAGRSRAAGEVDHVPGRSGLFRAEVW